MRISGAGHRGSGTELGVTAASGYCTVLCFGSGGTLMAVSRWTVWVEAARPDGTTERVEVAGLERDLSSPGLDDLGLRLAEAKDLLRALQSYLCRDQIKQLSTVDRLCCRCGSRRSLHDYRRRQVATLFGRVPLRQPRWRACGCNRIAEQQRPDGTVRQSWTSALIGARATPELVRVQAELGARLSFREAARVMSVLLPTSKAANHTGVRRRLAQTADRLQALDNASPHRMSRAKGSPMVVSLDGAHIRAVPGFQVRHFEVTVGRVETEHDPARHFAVAPNAQATRPRTIGNALRAQGWLPGRDVVVLSDGDPALVESVRAAAGGEVRHILDWFHISMRVRHVEQALAGLLGSNLEHKGPLTYVEYDVARLRHLIWNGYGKEARRALQNIRYMAGNAVWLNGQSGKARIERFAQLARELETYLTLNAAALVDYGRRYRAGLRIATSGAESVVNSLVNMRMNKQRQMRWSPQGAHRVLQVRAAVIDGRMSAGKLHVAA
jgi:hypothetical protein